MIEYIKGKIDIKADDYIVVQTGAIGYKINTSLNTLANIGPVGDEIKIYTYMYVRDDAITLYGFSTSEELRIYKLLISVSGVGPKAALSILSVTTPASFGIAVISEDEKTLSKAKGVGKKTAQRIIVDLKDKIKKNRPDTLTKDLPKTSKEDIDSYEAIDALMVLGYSKQEASNVVSKVIKDCNSLEEVIKTSLKKLTAGII